MGFHLGAVPRQGGGSYTSLGRHPCPVGLCDGRGEHSLSFLKYRGTDYGSDQIRLLLRPRRDRRRRQHEEPPRRQGRQPGRDGQAGPAGAAGFTITTDYCMVYLKEGRSIPTKSAASWPRPWRRSKRHGHEVRRRQESAAGLLPLRRPQVDARHDGNGAQRGPVLGDHPRHDREDRERAVRLRRLPPPDHDVFRRGHGKGRRHRAGRGPGHPRAARARSCTS